MNKLPRVKNENCPSHPQLRDIQGKLFTKMLIEKQVIPYL